MIPPDDTSVLYDSDYYNGVPRRYHDPDGAERMYYGPARRWHGFDLICAALLELLPSRPETALDVGCGPGDWVRAMSEAGIDARGVDHSTYAVASPVPGAEGRLSLCDLSRESLPWRRYDMVTGLDLLEHMYVDQVPGVLRKIAAASVRYVFLCVCVATEPEHAWNAVRGEPVSCDRQWQAISGHFTCQSGAWWRERAQEAGVTLRLDLMARFEQWRSGHREMSGVAAWGPNNVIIGEVDRG